MSIKHLRTYPTCNCPFDAPGDPNWCARGYPKQRATIATPSEQESNCSACRGAGCELCPTIAGMYQKG